MTALSDEQKLRVKMIQFLTGRDTTTADAVNHGHIAPEDIVEYEAQLVDYGLIRVNTFQAQPRYVMEDAGWVYLGVTRKPGFSQSVAEVRSNVPGTIYTGNDSTTLAALDQLCQAGLTVPAAGYDVTAE